MKTMDDRHEQDAFYCLHSDLCKTLANPKRQRILDTLRDRELSVGEIADGADLSQSNVSQHLSLMLGKGIVVRRREGSRVYYRIRNPKILEAFDLISEVLRETLASQTRTLDEAIGGADA